MTSITPLREFVEAFTALIDRDEGQERILDQGAVLLRALIAHDRWLPEQFARPDPERYSQYLLHADPYGRFSVVSFVWGPGQTTPLHDHRVWGLIGILRGREREESYSRTEAGFEREGEEILEPGHVGLLRPGERDYHRVSNALTDETSLSIHVYGANIGAVARATYDIETGQERIFISGYSSNVVPNLWDLTK
ncbi:cysteine dioxygenase [Asaia sp. As-1742]|uniref:cysteine dioxygenase family protein n=1 Tax=Asaia sp. As-1742 TaxID=2608325 RepID=UPI001424777E|nr:cysteine dioxygenase [Asaia sp. As-1742]NIE81607.1 cysteine dioxygenase [Asaia sp. As-1742]